MSDFPHASRRSSTPSSSSSRRGHGHRRSPLRRPLARCVDAGRARAAGFIDRWTATFGALDPATLTADEVIDRDLVLGELEASASARPSCARRRGTRSRGSTCWATASSRCLPASSPRWPTGSPASPAASRAMPARRSTRARGDARRDRRRPAGRAVPDRDRARAAAPASTSSSTRRWPPTERARPTTPAVAGGPARGCDAAARRPREAPRAASRRTCATSSLPRERGRGPAGRRPVRREDAPHDALGRR